MIRNKIVDAYVRYRKNLLDTYVNPQNFNVVIRISPEKFFDLANELSKDNMYMQRDIEAECFFIILFDGIKTPVIIDNDLPKNTEFIIQSQKDYERKEREKQLQKFFKMFGD